mgnify:CR=1 FL=1
MVKLINASSLRRLLLLAAGAAFITTSFAADEFIPVDNIERRGDLYYAMGEDQPVNGVVIVTYDDGSRKLEQPLKDGKQVGTQKQWHEDGVQKAEIKFRDGKLHGYSTWWYPNGMTRVWLGFQDGKLHGRGMSWHENGRVKSDGEFRHGEAVRKHRFWDENGRRLYRRPRDYPEVPRTGLGA